MPLTPPPQTTVFFQDKCLAHRYIRSNDTSMIFERPQRLRAVKIGVATAIARLEELNEKNAKKASPKDASNSEDALSTALQRLNLAEQSSGGRQDAIEVVMSTASVDILNHAAVKFVHGDIGGDVYLERLVALCRESEEKVARGESEIPEDLSQTDLYLCGESLDAIQGSIGTVCEAVDAVLEATHPSSSEAPTHTPPKALSSSRAFVAIRPPGHHCGEDTPSGFCFVNNVAIGAAHAHLKHGVNRVVVLDIDLHHGNGTQSIAWQINEEAYLRQTELEDVATSSSSPLQVFYGSIHDPLSYPCEGGNTAMIQAASVSIHGPHGQYIENVHLLPYRTEAEFWDSLYHGPYHRLLEKAESFLRDHASPEDAMVFISAGFDASEHETASMSRHGRKLPTSFFKRFSRDVRVLADKYARGRIVSVLEGGYSDRALCSGAMAHVLGLAEEDAEVDESWWSMENLAKLEKMTKKRRGGRSSTSTVSDKWLERTLSLLTLFDPNYSPPPTPKSIPPSTMTLRDRTKKANSITPSSSESGILPAPSHSAIGASKEQKAPLDTEDEVVNPKSATGAEVSDEAPAAKKLPRVVLKVNPPPGPNHPPSQT